MLGLDVCEFGGQVLELLWLTMCYRGILADKKDLYIEEEEDDRNLGYTAPVQKSLEEIQALDKDDESLNVQVTRLTLLCDEAPRPLTMDLTEVSDQKDKKTISIKEGVTFRLKIDFKVNGEIVSGLRYHHKMFRKGIIGARVYNPVEEAANGVKSCLKDDDKNVNLSWEWSLEINKDWIE
ncbi:hypothetical protein F7725_003757 [Dissostichus mawsoni]|uniref:Uncharacterized protein n=1 Tax=Dissostichus mawsoni TaxID=36200 RepID=A0A7J5YD26_DISMA|nr:hypothetical protein F7725_003757 [Dissostichus mawsoni]